MEAKLLMVNQSLNILVTFLKSALPFLNCNLNEFYTSNLWKTLLPSKLRLDLEINREALLTNYLKLFGSVPWADDDPKLVFLSQPLQFEELELEELVYQIRQLSLLNIQASVLVANVHFPKVDDWESIKKKCELGERKFDSLMSLKKEHEVKIMSQFVASLVKHITLERYEAAGGKSSSSCPDDSEPKQRIKHLIDLGSGKGYLSCFLTLLYRFNVLAIDSSAVNTEGSKKWADNVYRIWKRVRMAMTERKHNLSSTHMKCATTGKPILNIRGSNEHTSLPKATSSSTSAQATPSASTEEIPQLFEPVLLKNLRLFITEDIDLDEGMSHNFGPECKTKKSESKSNAPENDLEYGLLGLHTCGSLGSDSLKLFLNSKNAQFLCNVPCCHNLLQEPEYVAEGDETNLNYKRDFPLSKLLLDQKFSLGSKARMLASRSPHKMARSVDSAENENWFMPQSLHYRSLLEIIIKGKLEHTKLEHRLGNKIGLMASCFVQYVRLALAKLCLDDQIQITDEEIEAIEQQHDSSREQFFCFYLLRTIFAPLLDGCIVLDRLAYLCEQECVEKAYIVQLFDPAISPRCHALVAIKKEVSTPATA